MEDYIYISRYIHIKYFRLINYTKMIKVSLNFEKKVRFNSRFANISDYSISRYQYAQLSSNCLAEKIRRKIRLSAD